jgi:transporter family-2 protein
MILVRYALWAVLAGAFIPVMAVLNARLGRALGEPLNACVVLFAVALAAAGAASLLLAGRLPSPAALAGAPPATLAGGLIVAFYVVSVTLLAPKFGVGNVILFAMTAQILTSAAVDHFGLFGAAVRRVNVVRLLGLLVLLIGLLVTQLSAGRPAPPTS